MNAVLPGLGPDTPATAPAPKSSAIFTEKRASLKTRRNDFYASPPQAAHGLIAAEREWLPSFLWECACGDGALVNPLRAAGYTVGATDLVDRGCPGSLDRVDFLLHNPPMRADGIVTNPPFKLAREFVDVALERADYVAMFLRLAFLEAARRREFFETTPLSAVHIFSDRLPMMHREGYEGPKVDNGGIAFAWFVWDRRRGPERRLHWISDSMIEDGRRACEGSDV